MVRKALIVKQRRLLAERNRCHEQGIKMKHPTRFYNRCQITGRSRSYMGDYGVSRIFFRKAARQGNIVGLTKSSW